SCAARLRRLDEHAEIVLLERGEYISFANCGLPYYIGGEIEEEQSLTLQTPERFRSRFNIDVRTRNEAVDIDPVGKAVTVKDLQTGETYTEHYDKLVLSPGAAPIRPALEGIDCERVFTLRNIPDTMRIKQYIDELRPRSAAIVGGGYIGLEMAENLKRAGLAVTLIELSDHLIASLDFDMAADVHHYVTDRGIRLELSNGLQSIRELDGRLLLTLQRGTLETDMLILAVGVRPEIELAKRAGLTITPRGCIAVDRRMQTSDADIYAVGDAVQVRNLITQELAFLPLAGPANKQGRIAADNICGIPSEYQGTQGSAILRLFDMAIAATGLNEKGAKAAGIDYDKTYIYSTSHASYYPGATMMSVKVLWDKRTTRIIGAQIVGFDGVDKRMDVIATAIRLGASVQDLAELELCYAPPFSSAKDPVNMIGFVAENVISGKLKQFFWHDVENLPRDGSVTLLDTRTETERARGHIDGFIHIPLDALRENLHLLPTGRPVYVHCHSGLRSYIACRVLAGHGYDCYNLAGGWRLYESVLHARTVPPYVCTECK
ncbi:MAG: FAD-dependent oxidoreductase, partial [Clostridia bacterium]|nr:FAD-dependent oxidoreductase [Clostridia bacterium]